MSKKATFTADGKKQRFYDTLLKQRHILPPSGYAYDTQTERLVQLDAVFGSGGALLGKYAGRKVVDRVIYDRDTNVTLSVMLYAAMVDEEGAHMKVAKAKARADGFLAHA